MASRNYQKGYRFENRTRKYLERLGWYVIRSYRSWGIYDLIAIPPQDKKDPLWRNVPLLIQCKYNGYVKPAERKALEDSSKKYCGLVVVVSTAKRKLVFKRVEQGRPWSIMRGIESINDS